MSRTSLPLSFISSIILALSFVSPAIGAETGTGVMTVSHEILDVRQNVTLTFTYLNSSTLDVGSKIGIAFPNSTWSDPSTECNSYDSHTGIQEAFVRARRGGEDWGEGLSVVVNPMNTIHSFVEVRIEERPVQAGIPIEIEYGGGQELGCFDAVVSYVAIPFHFKSYFIEPSESWSEDALLVTYPVIDIRPGSPEKLYVSLPSDVVRGEYAIPLRVVVMDRYFNKTHEYGEASVEVDYGEDLVDFPYGTDFPIDDGIGTTEMVPKIPSDDQEYGLLRIKASYGELQAFSPFIKVYRERPDRRLFWGSIHNHDDSNIGVGSTEYLMEYAKYIAGLDFFAVSNKTTMLADPFPWTDMDQETWLHIIDVTNSYNIEESDLSEGESPFVTLLSMEWDRGNSNREEGDSFYGHKNILYLPIDSSGDYSVELPYSFTAEESNTPCELWWRLKEDYYDIGFGENVMTIQHASARLDGGHQYLWTYHPSMCDPPLPDDFEVEVVGEFYSSHGSSEFLNYDPENDSYSDPSLAPPYKMMKTEESFFRGAITGHTERGYKFYLGFVADGDVHEGIIKFDQWLKPGSDTDYAVEYGIRPNGLTGVYSEGLTREGVFSAYKNRLLYGTTGDRIRLEFDLLSGSDRFSMGSRDAIVNISGCPDNCPDVRFNLHVIADTRPLMKVEIFWFSEETGEWQTAIEYSSSSGVSPFTLNGYELKVSFDPLATSTFSPDMENIYYVRVLCEKGEDETFREQAWSSPIWVYYDTTAPPDEEIEGDGEREDAEAGCGECRVIEKGEIGPQVLLLPLLLLFVIITIERRRVI